MKDNKNKIEELWEEDIGNSTSKHKYRKRIYVILSCAFIAVVVLAAILASLKILDVDLLKHKTDNIINKEQSVTDEPVEKLESNEELFENLIKGLKSFNKDIVMDSVDYNIEQSLNGSMKNVYKDTLKSIEYEKVSDDVYKVTYLDLSKGAKEVVNSTSEDSNKVFTDYYKLNKPDKKSIEIKLLKDSFDGKLLLTKEMIVLLSSGISNIAE